MSVKVAAVGVAALIVGVVIGLVAASILTHESGSQESASFCPSEVQGKLTEEELKILEKKLNEMYSFINPALHAEVVNVSTQKTYGLYPVKVKLYFAGREVSTMTYYVTEDVTTAFLEPIDLAVSSPERAAVTADDDPMRGAGDAPVEIVIFGDYADPYTKEIETNVTPAILSKYEGGVRVVYRDFPTLGEKSYVAAIAANCAGEQGKYWDFHDSLFLRQDEWVGEGHESSDVNYTRQKMVEFAEGLGLNVTQFEQCLNSTEARKEVEADYSDAIHLGLSQAPTVFVNGLKIEGFVDFNVLSSYVERELQVPPI